MESAKHGEGVRPLPPRRGELSLRHGSCSLSFSGHSHSTAHLLCTSIMFKASMEVMGGQQPRCVTGDPQGDWEPSEAIPRQECWCVLLCDGFPALEIGSKTKRISEENQDVAE